ncbi:MAG: class I SAM-dependent methyltransferase [Pseudomonadota bacterium]
MDSQDWKAISANTQAVYEENAVTYDLHRSRLAGEEVWLKPFVEAVQPKGHILDLGCGAGEPVSRYLLDCGFALTGLDYAPAMIALAEGRFVTTSYPRAKWVVGDMRDPDEYRKLGPFDAIVSWGGFFHLTVTEQKAALPRLMQQINPGGAILLTIGTGEGEVTGTVAGKTVFHASLAPETYRDFAEAEGFRTIEIVLNDERCGGHSLFFAAHKTGTA